MTTATIASFITPDWPAPPGVRALCTTRAGGVSGAPFASLNLGTHVGDAPAAVAENRARLRALLPAEPCWMEQVHGVEVIDADVAAPGERADGAIARRPGSVCVVMLADCLPVLLAARDGRAVGVAHAGWRGLAGGVIEATLARLAVPAADVLAWLGPAIGARAYEVGDEVREAFVAREAAATHAFVDKGAGKHWCDLAALARMRLARAGVASIHGGGFCTASDADRFFSFRRDGRTGRMAALIWLADR